MRRYFKVILVLLLMIPCIIFADTKKVNMYLFYGDGCPHCEALETFLNGYLKEHKNVEIQKFEVWHNQENVKKLHDIMDILKTKETGIPYLVIGNSAIVGYDEAYTPERIKNAVTYYSNYEYSDKVGAYLRGEKIPEDTPKKDENKKPETKEIDIPIIGKKDVKKVSLLLSAIVIGLVDGFNPCAMWILLFLISMLIGMKSTKRKWALGITFLTSSALVYFLFLISWLSLATFLNSIIYIRTAIACFALIFGIISITRFLKGLLRDDGCEVVDQNNRKRIIKAIKKIVTEKSFFLALLGIVLLAFSVNIIELLCSLGLPVMFSEILTLNNVNNTMKIIYSLVYVFFFLIDDIIIFIIAMKTLEIKAISNKFGKYSHLIGGLIMLAIGLLMLYKPEWLMFNF